MSDTAIAAAKSTEAFIAENPIDVRFRRGTRTKTSAGGFVTSAPTPIPPQTVRLVSQRGYLVDQRLNESGEVSVPRFVVVGMPDVDMKRGDLFDHEGETFRIGRINTSPPWAKRGEAFEHGE